jgi:hypothetical protein
MPVGWTADPRRARFTTKPAPVTDDSVGLAADDGINWNAVDLEAMGRLEAMENGKPIAPVKVSHTHEDGNDGIDCEANERSIYVCHRALV